MKEILSNCFYCTIYGLLGYLGTLIRYPLATVTSILKVATYPLKLVTCKLGAVTYKLATVTSTLKVATYPLELATCKLGAVTYKLTTVTFVWIFTLSHPSRSGWVMKPCLTIQKYLYQ